LFAFPYLLIAIVIAFLLSNSIGKGVLTAAIAITAAYVPLYFRVVRNHVISIREEPYVDAARALGARPRTVIRNSVFFNVGLTLLGEGLNETINPVLRRRRFGRIDFGPPTPTEAENL